ncbi:MAG: gluconeogenesis factor YvcK family protein, partial [Patescibacteria group bacterium]
MIPKPKVVAIGGGTGLSTLLRGLKNHPISLSGIVTMTDNGASSGRLSREMGVLPPGDIRKCLAALSNDEQLLTKLFEYRFNRGRGLSGHSLGNLLLIALSDITGGFDSAVEASSKILSIKGQVIPSTLDHVSLIAELNNGQSALGEVDIPKLGHRFGIGKISIVPPDAVANPTAVHFINNADLIIVGPGSLYTSILPSFL